MSKKFLAKLLVLVMLLTMLPFSAFAANTGDGGTADDNLCTLNVKVDTVENEPTKIKLTVSPDAADNSCTTYYSFSETTPKFNDEVIIVESLSESDATTNYAPLSSNTSGEVVVLASAKQVQVVRGTRGTGDKASTLTVTAAGTGTINNNTGSQDPVVTVAIDESAAETLTESTTETSVEDARKATVTLATPAGYTMKVTKESGAEGDVTESDNGTEVKLDTGTNVINITLTKTDADPITYKVTITNNSSSAVQPPEVSITVGGETTKLNTTSNAPIDVTNGENAVVTAPEGYTVTVTNDNGTATEEKTVTLGDGANVITITLTKTDDQSTTFTYTVTINNKVGEDPNPPVGDDGYTITNGTAADANGTLTVAESAKAGDEVTFTVTPKEGYEVDTISVTYTEDGTVVEYEETADGFTFVMPAANVTIAVTFKQIPPQPSQNVSLLVNAVSDAGSDAGSKELLDEANLDATKTYVINVDSNVGEVTFTTNAVITKDGETISGEAVALAEGVNEYTLTAGDKEFKLTIVRAKATQDETTNVAESAVEKKETDLGNGNAKIEAEVPETATLEQIANTTEGGTVSIPAVESNPNGNVTSSTVSLPQTVTESMKDKDVNVEIATNVGTVTIPSEAVVQALTDKDGVTSAELKLVVENAVNPDTTIVKAIFEVSIKMIVTDESTGAEDEKDTNITNLEKPIKLAFKFENKDGLHEPTLAHVVKEGGKIAYRSIKNSSYDPKEKIITGETDHLSEFAVVDLYQLEDFGDTKLTLRRDPSENWLGGIKVVVTNAVTSGSDPVYFVQYKDPEKDMFVYTVVRPDADGTVSFIAMNNSEVCVFEALDGALDTNGKFDIGRFGRTNDIEIDSSEELGFKGEVVTKSMATVE